MCDQGDQVTTEGTVSKAWKGTWKVISLAVVSAVWLCNVIDTLYETGTVSMVKWYYVPLLQ